MSNHQSEALVLKPLRGSCLKLHRSSCLKLRIWDRIWDNVFNASKTPNHQLIQYNLNSVIEHTGHQLIGFTTTSLNCDLCDEEIPGTFKHMVWDCQEVQYFWKKVILLTFLYTQDCYCVMMTPKLSSLRNSIKFGLQA